MMKNQTMAVIRSTKPEDGFTFQRVPGGAYIPPLLNPSVWFRHINHTARYAAYARVMRDMNRLTRDPEWRSTFKDKAGEKHYKALRDWIQYNANPGRKLLNTALDQAGNILRSTATALILGFKTAVGLKQRASMFNAAKAMGGKSFFEGWKYIVGAVGHVDFRTSVFGLSQSGSWEHIKKASGYLKTREKDIDREISDMTRGIDPLTKRIKIGDKVFTAKDIQNFAFEWIRMNDRAAVSVVWTGAYNQFIQKKANKTDSSAVQHKEAVRYADGIVQDTQPSSLSPELSQLQRQEGWIRLFTLFMTFTLKYGNRLMQHKRALSQGAIGSKEYFNFIMQEVILGPWLAMTISSIVVMGEFPELEDLVSEPFFAAVSWIPLLRDIAGAVRFNKDIGASPVGEPVTRILKAGQAPGKLFSGDSNFWEAAWDIGRALEAYYRVSPSNFAKDVLRITENLSNI